MIKFLNHSNYLIINVVGYTYATNYPKQKLIYYITMIATTYTPISLEKIDTLDSSTLGIVEFAKGLINNIYPKPSLKVGSVVWVE
jgi:hypothetical protein